jgi:flagellar biosynthesis protein FlhF
MKVKKFYGVDNYDVIAKVKSELGSDAVILHQRKVKPKGLMGFLKKSMIEVVAAIEENEISTTTVDSVNMAKTQELDLRQRTALKSNEKELKR